MNGNDAPVQGQGEGRTSLLTAGNPRSIAADATVAVVVPTYNEADNLPELADRLFGQGIPGVRLIVVDDDSPDGTAGVVERLSEHPDQRIDLIRRAGKQGLGTAYLAGFSRALQIGADYVVQMDADLSHPPEYVPALLERLDEADVVVGSRYVARGGAEDEWSRSRRLLSGFGNTGLRLVSGLRVRDATSGFKAFRGQALRGIDFSHLRCKGFGFQVEMAAACQRKGYTIVEHPIVFMERSRGESKMSLAIVLEAIWRLLPLRFLA